MSIAGLILDYVRALIWPSVAAFALISYRRVIDLLIPGSKVKFTISGVTIETTVPILENSVNESLRGRRLTPAQWDWLKKLQAGGRITYNHAHYLELRPLRNSGLIREHPEGWLSNCEEIEITTLGTLLLDAAENSRRRPSM